MAEWKTLFDIDFAAQGSQALNADGDYTIGGQVFTKFHSDNDATAMALTNGAGVVMIPKQATNYDAGDRTLPGLFMKLATALPSFTLETPLRAWIYVSDIANLSASYLGVTLTFDHGSQALAYQTRLIFIGDYGGIGHYCQGFMNNWTQGDIWVAGYGATNDVLVLECPTGVGSGKAMALAGTWAAGWPAVGTLLPLAGYTMMYRTSTNIMAYGSLAADWGILIGAERAGGATALTSTFANMRVEYKI